MGKTKILVLIDADNGERRISVPESAVVTFGAAVPYMKKNGYDRPNEYALRVYEDKKAKHAIAVFTGVKEFREEYIKVEKLVIREAGKAIWKSDEAGFHQETNVERKRVLLPDTFDE